MKVCRICKEEKPIKEFRINKHGVVDSYCAPCRSGYAKAWRKKNWKQVKENHRIYARNNRDKMNAINRRWAAKNPDYWKNYNQNKKSKS